MNAYMARAVQSLQNYKGYTTCTDRNLAKVLCFEGSPCIWTSLRGVTVQCGRMRVLTFLLWLSHPRFG